MRRLDWVGSSRADLQAMPGHVRDDIGYALYIAQTGGKHESAKPLKGFKGAGVLEVVERHDGDTYRAVYTVRLKAAIYVLHVFQKKSKRGTATPQADIEVIKSRLKLAAADARENGHD